MEKWEYCTIRIGYDKKKHKNWVVDAEKAPLVGLSAILETYGSRGWELVTLFLRKQKRFLFILDGFMQTEAISSPIFGAN